MNAGLPSLSLYYEYKYRVIARTSKRILGDGLNIAAILGASLVSTGKFLLTVIPLYILGVILAQLLVELRWIDKLVLGCPSADAAWASPSRMRW